MNPATIMRLWKAFEYADDEVHILTIGAISGCWPGTVYKAVSCGYLTRTCSAHYIPTSRMLDEVRRVEGLWSERGAHRSATGEYG